MKAFWFDLFCWSVALQSAIYLWTEAGRALWGVQLFACVLAAVLYVINAPTLGRKLWPKSRAADSENVWLWRTQLLFVLILVTAASLKISNVSFSELFNIDGLQGAWRIFAGIFQPDLLVLGLAAEKMRETFLMSFLATLLFLPVAFVLGFFAARNFAQSSALRGLYVFIRVCLNAIRSMEVLVWAIIFSVWVGIGPFAGVLALAIHSAASLLKQFSELIEGSDALPVESLRTMGANRAQQTLFAILPQVVLPFIAFTIYRWDTNLRMATVVGLVGGGGIGTLLIKYVGLGQWHELGTVVLLIALCVWVMDMISAWVREALK